MLVINSQENINIKEVRSLSMKKQRDAKGVFVVEGVRAVRDAFEAGADVKVEKLFLSEKVLNSGDLGAKIMDNLSTLENVFLVREELFSKISGTETPQGVLAVVRQPRYDIDSIIMNANFVVVLENIQDPGNLGTIIRTADAVGADIVLLTNGCVDIYNAKVVRSTMASLFHVPVGRMIGIEQCYLDLKSAGFRIIATKGEGVQSYLDTDFSGKVAIVVGNEANGLTQEAIEQADLCVGIPMHGKADSLNVAVAAGILMYEKIASRKKM